MCVLGNGIETQPFNIHSETESEHNPWAIRNGNGIKAQQPLENIFRSGTETQTPDTFFGYGIETQPPRYIRQRNRNKIAECMFGKKRSNHNNRWKIHHTLCKTGSNRNHVKYVRKRNRFMTAAYVIGNGVVAATGASPCDAQLNPGLDQAKAAAPLPDKTKKQTHNSPKKQKDQKPKQTRTKTNKNKIKPNKPSEPHKSKNQKVPNKTKPTQTPTNKDQPINKPEKTKKRKNEKTKKQKKTIKKKKTKQTHTNDPTSSEQKHAYLRLPAPTSVYANYSRPAPLLRYT